MEDRNKDKYQQSRGKGDRRGQKNTVRKPYTDRVCSTISPTAIFHVFIIKYPMHKQIESKIRKVPRGI